MKGLRGALFGLCVNSSLLMTLLEEQWMLCGWQPSFHMHDQQVCAVIGFCIKNSFVGLALFSKPYVETFML